MFLSMNCSMFVRTVVARKSALTGFEAGLQRSTLFASQL